MTKYGVMEHMLGKQPTKAPLEFDTLVEAQGFMEALAFTFVEEGERVSCIDRYTFVCEHDDLGYTRMVRLLLPEQLLVERWQWAMLATKEEEAS